MDYNPKAGELGTHPCAGLQVHTGLWLVSKLSSLLVVSETVALFWAIVACGDDV